MVKEFDVMQVFTFTKIYFSKYAFPNHVFNKNILLRVTKVFSHHVLAAAFPHRPNQLMALFKGNGRGNFADNVLVSLKSHNRLRYMQILRRSQSDNINLIKHLLVFRETLFYAVLISNIL